MTSTPHTSAKIISFATRREMQAEPQRTALHDPVAFNAALHHGAPLAEVVARMEADMAAVVHGALNADEPPKGAA